MQPLVGEAAEIVTKQVVSTIVDAVIPLSTVNNLQFIKLLNMLQPRYQVPSRRTIQRRIIFGKEVVAERQKGELQQDMGTKLSNTIDSWSSRVFRSYVTVAAHWISENWKMKTVLLMFSRFPSTHDDIVVPAIIDNSL